MKLFIIKLFTENIYAVITQQIDSTSIETIKKFQLSPFNTKGKLINLSIFCLLQGIIFFYATREYKKRKYPPTKTFIKANSIIIISLFLYFFIKILSYYQWITLEQKKIITNPGKYDYIYFFIVALLIIIFFKKNTFLNKYKKINLVFFIVCMFLFITPQTFIVSGFSNTIPRGAWGDVLTSEDPLSLYYPFFLYLIIYKKIIFSVISINLLTITIIENRKYKEEDDNVNISTTK